MLPVLHYLKNELGFPSKFRNISFNYVVERYCTSSQLLQNTPNFLLTSATFATKSRNWARLNDSCCGIKCLAPLIEGMIAGVCLGNLTRWNVHAFWHVLERDAFLFKAAGNAVKQHPVSAVLSVDAIKTTRLKLMKQSRVGLAAKKKHIGIEIAS